jgi:uncharacterized membrane protein YcaP (DUF421 family)
MSMEIPDWSEVFLLSLPWLEIVARGSAIYWFIFLVFRVILRRDAGNIAIADVLLVVIIADAAQHGMAGKAHSVADAMVLMSTIIGWNLLIDLLCYRSPRLARLLEPQPLLLVKDGQILHRNLRREMISNADLAAMLRDKGIHKFEQVKRARMESNGQLSVMRRDEP